MTDKEMQRRYVSQCSSADWCSGYNDAVEEANIIINRQNAEIERLTTLAELGNMRANDYRATRDKLKSANAEIERLTSNIEAMAQSMPTMAKAERAEAYKECIEKIKEISEKETYCDNRLLKPIRTYHIIEDELDNLLKEMVGEG